MRIAYVCADPGVPVYGRKGSSVHAQEVIRALLAQGARVDLFAARFDGEAPTGLEGVRVYPLPRIKKGDEAAREQAALAANGALRHALRQAGPYDMLYERYSLWSFEGMEYARDAGIPGLLEVNSPLIEEQARHRGLVDRAGAERVARRAFAAASALLAVSQEVADYLDGSAEARGRAQVLPNGVAPERFPADITPTLSAAQGTFTAGFIGTLKPWHGLGTLVEAFGIHSREYPGSRLLVVGDGPEREGMEAGLLEQGLHDTALFTGAVAPDEIPGLLASMDVAAAPYPAQAGFYFSPLKVYEYMAAGLPVVASRIGQLDGLIKDGVNGILLPPGDAAALAGALSRLRHDPGLRAMLGREARATVLRDHTWEAVARRILAPAHSAANRAYRAYRVDSPMEMPAEMAR